MNTLILAIVFLVMSIAIFIAAILLTNSLYTNDKKEEDCERNNSVGNKKCNIWIDNKCRKGTLNDSSDCVSKGNILPLLLFVLSLIFFVLSIFYFVKTFMLKHHK